MRKMRMMKRMLCRIARLKRKAKKAMNREYTMKLGAVRPSELGIPVIKLKSGDMEGYFVIDTGCEYSTIDASVLPLTKHKLLEETTEYSGIEGEKHQASTAKVYFDMCGKKDGVFFLVADFSNMIAHTAQNSGRKIAGLLGTSFFGLRGSVIDYDKLQITNRLKKKKMSRPTADDKQEKSQNAATTD